MALVTTEGKFIQANKAFCAHARAAARPALLAADLETAWCMPRTSTPCTAPWTSW